MARATLGVTLVLTGCAGALNPAPATVTDPDGPITLTLIEVLGGASGSAPGPRSTAFPAAPLAVTAVAARGSDVFVVDPAVGAVARLSRFNGRTEPLRRLSGYAGPGLHATRDGALLVPDGFERAVVRLWTDGREAGRYAHSSHLRDPVDVVEDERSGDVIVLDGLTGHLVVFGAVGGLVDVVETGTGASPARALAGDDQTLALVHSGPPWVRFVDRHSRQIRNAAGLALAGTTAAAVDRCGRVFAAGASQSTLLVWPDPAGDPIGLPLRIAGPVRDLWASDGRLYVATGAAGVAVFLVQPPCE